MVLGAKMRRVDGKVVTTTAKVTALPKLLEQCDGCPGSKQQKRLLLNKMDNAPIHKPATVRNLIESRG